MEIIKSSDNLQHGDGIYVNLSSSQLIIIIMSTF
jgi:hypothetical protein